MPHDWTWTHRQLYHCWNEIVVSKMSTQRWNRWPKTPFLNFNFFKALNDSYSLVNDNKILWKFFLITIFECVRLNELFLDSLFRISSNTREGLYDSNFYLPKCNWMLYVVRNLEQLAKVVKINWLRSIFFFVVNNSIDLCITKPSITHCSVYYI